ncbi:hypothetical protein BO94DRAFT_604240 [Aspergillus sclerotioniger CBS 115572]|uniref:Ubiquitin-like domain-containing protein n=1 Tax=Aspergillus sclerotioniger CBS 115572 TaxID=1450535 RepID=A0A317VW72_9EURO|nr:hypothetical protein BO94DRAFT_604240 [Aspergillus sclerotioniger CBS 115572]PWY77148.1 hypothetical protein BO94DRAFT_604240 [Aspergillus sclerotioniger CBS 115572]
MTFNITIGPSPHDSDHSSLSDEEDSSGVQVSPISDSESHGYHDHYEEWAHLTYPDEIKPSDSASRPRTTRRTRTRSIITGPTSTADRRHSARRHLVQERDTFSRRSRRHPSPDSPESADSAEEYGSPYGHASQERRYWSSVPQVPGYARSSSPGPSYVYPSGTSIPHAPFMHPAGLPPSDQLVRLSHNGQVGQQTTYTHPVYGYTSQLQQPHGPPMPPFFVHEHHPGHHPHQVSTASHSRGDGHNPPQHAMSHHISPHGPSPYGAPPLGPHDLVPYGPGSYYPFREPYPIVPGMISPYFNPYPRVPSPSQVESSESPAPAPAPAPAPVDTAKDEAIARLEKLIMEERTEREAREAREAARQAAIEQEAAEQVSREERAAHEKKITEEAAARARAEAEQKAAEEAAKAKQEAEEAATAAAAEAAAAATEAANAAAAEAVAAATAAAAAAAAAPPPPEKKKPIKFKDAVGRKFSFPFELCCTWQGMEELIRQAFLHIEVIGLHVAEGHYDLVGPNGDIILPQVWETVIEPDWTITMHMWPIPEKPKTPEPIPPPDPPAPQEPPPPEVAAAPVDEAIVILEEPKKKAEPAGG